MEGGVNIMGGQKYFIYEKGGDRVLFKVLIKGGWKIDHSIFEMALLSTSAIDYFTTVCSLINNGYYFLVWCCLFFFGEEGVHK